MDGSFSRETRDQVRMRARSECERCGRWAGEGAWAEFHHRQPRAMGGADGARAVMLAAASNCVLLCHLCHRWVESHRADAEGSGWLVPYGLDPADVEVDVRGRGPVLLTSTGGYRRKAPTACRKATTGKYRVRW